MEKMAVTLDFPRNILAALDVSETQLAERLREMIVLELVRDGRISAGKGAEIMGMAKADFMSLMGQNDIPCFTEAPDELSAQVRMMKKLLRSGDA